MSCFRLIFASCPSCIRWLLECHACLTTESRSSKAVRARAASSAHELRHFTPVFNSSEPSQQSACQTGFGGGIQRCQRKGTKPQSPSFTLEERSCEGTCPIFWQVNRPLGQADVPNEEQSTKEEKRFSLSFFLYSKDPFLKRKDN